MAWDLLVIAPPADADALVRAQPGDAPWGWSHVDHNGSTLSLLVVALRGEVVEDDAMSTVAWDCLAQDDVDEGPWVYDLPAELRAGLGTEFEEVAARWGEADLLSPYALSELIAFLEQLRAALTEAQASGQRVLYWCSA